MLNNYLDIYLNDHLAGSVAMVELLTDLENQTDGQVKSFLPGLRSDVLTDRGELQRLMHRLEIAESGARRAAAWLAEKVAEIKLRLRDGPERELHLLEALEMVAVGIEGKRALWRTLEVAASAACELDGIDFPKLAQRAEEQQHKVEEIRLGLAAKALTSSPELPEKASE